VTDYTSQIWKQEADRGIPDCRKCADMNFKPECYVLGESDPCWPCRTRRALGLGTLNESDYEDYEDWMANK